MIGLTPQTRVKGVVRQQQQQHVFNRPRSEVEDAELVVAKGLTIFTALDCFHYQVRGECSYHLKWFPLGFPRHYSGLS